jgi:hypothetical protein
MRDRFPWYFVEKSHYEDAWNKGILTVDANVMLDLYRYNSATREALLQALESFTGRLWISHQTSIEFVKNRKTVIVGVSSEFDKTLKHFDEISTAAQKSLASVRALRAIPRSLSETLEKSIETSLQEAKASIVKERSSSPTFEDDDEIVLRLEKALSGNIGNQPGDLDEAIKEAERRKKEEIPPGYKDDDKDGLGFAGDYLMWREILAHGKQKSSPVILVTSEQKEDWWEVKNGKTLNPRRELLKEAFEQMGNRIFIYHTDRFLQLHQEKTARKLNDSVFEEIREVSRERERAVKSIQEVELSSLQSNKGRVRVTLLRPVRNFTASGRFDPNLQTVPGIAVRLLDGPEELPDITLHANTGTTFDFNIHVQSTMRGKMLPEGEYLLAYEAACRPLGDSAD